MDARSGRTVKRLQVVQAGCSALPLAQWLERRSYEPAAAGSSPAWEKLLRVRCENIPQKSDCPPVLRGHCPEGDPGVTRGSAPSREGPGHGFRRPLEALRRPDRHPTPTHTLPNAHGGGASFPD